MDQHRFAFGGLLLCLLFFCGCKESALHYVSPGAQYVVYGDVGKVLNHKFWKTFSRLPAYRKYVGRYLDSLHLTETDLNGTFAFWGAGEEVNGMVIVLKEDAGALMKKIREMKFAPGEEIRISPARCLDCDTLILNDALYLVRSGKRSLQIFLGEPLALHTAARKSKLAGMIDENALFAIAVTDGVLREILHIKEELPSTNLLQIRADDRKVSLEASWNIENIRDPFPLLEYLEP